MYARLRTKSATAYCYIPAPSGQGDRRGGTRRNIKSPSPLLPRATGYRMGMRGDMQPAFLSPSNPDWHGTHARQQQACWTFRGQGLPHRARVWAGLSGCLAGASYYSTYLRPPPLSITWSSITVCSGWGWRREGSLITCPRPGGPVNVTFCSSPVCVVDSSRMTAGWPSWGFAGASERSVQSVRRCAVQYARV